MRIDDAPHAVSFIHSLLAVSLVDDDLQWNRTRQAKDFNFRGRTRERKFGSPATEGYDSALPSLQTITSDRCILAVLLFRMKKKGKKNKKSRIVTVPL